jgi:hypothetical protein
MAKYWKSKTILCKMEAGGYAIDPLPTGAANAILGSDVTFSPMEGEWVKRNYERRSFGAKPGLGAAFRSVLTFSVEAAPSGTAGVAPAWGPLLRACAVAQVVTANTSVEYSPITDNPESSTLYFDVDGTLHKMLGTRGNVAFTLGASGIPMFKFTLTSLFTVPEEAAKPTPDYSQFKAPEVASKANTPTFTIGGIPFAMRNFELDLANDVQASMLVNQEEILIVDRDETLKVQVRAVPLGTYNPFTIAQAGTLQPIVLAHGRVAGRRLGLSLPTSQQQLPSYQEQQGILEWPLNFSPLPVAGDDQWKLTLT